MEIRIKTNFPEVQRALAKLQVDVGQKALASAINKSIAIAKTQMTREIPAEFNVSAGFVRQRLRVSRARASKGQVILRAELVASGKGRGRGANLIAFVTKAPGRKSARIKAGTQGMLFVKIKRKGAAKPVKGKYGHGAFVGNKGRTVFERVGDARLPIKPVTTIDVPQMFNTRRINGKVVQVMKQRFVGIFDNEARFFLARFNAGSK